MSQGVLEMYPKTYASKGKERVPLSKRHSYPDMWKTKVITDSGWFLAAGTM